MADEAAIAPELERRLALLEDPAHQGGDFTASTWFWLGLVGVLLPAALMLWGAA
jgi:hypothetical protein